MYKFYESAIIVDPFLAFEEHKGILLLVSINGYLTLNELKHGGDTTGPNTDMCSHYCNE